MLVLVLDIVVSQVGRVLVTAFCHRPGASTRRFLTWLSIERLLRFFFIILMGLLSSSCASCSYLYLLRTYLGTFLRPEVDFDLRWLLNGLATSARKRKIRERSAALPTRVLCSLCCAFGH